jgi:hypothetical protein
MRLDGDSNKWQIEPDLTPEELQAIGLITVQWAHLEHSLLVRTFFLAESTNVDMPKDATNTSFAKRLRAFRDLAKSIGDEDEKAAIEKLADHIANAEDQRHKITHGMWDWDEANPEKLAAYSFRKPFEYEHPFDLKKLHKLADRLGELLFELSFQNGLSDVQPMPFPQRFPGTPVHINLENNED